MREPITGAGTAGTAAATSWQFSPVVTAGPGPADFTYQEIQRSVFSPSRRIAASELMTEIATADSWSACRTSILFGTTASSLAGNSRVSTLTNGALYVGSGTVLVGTNHQLELELTDYTAATSNELQALIALRRPSEEIWIGVDLHSGGPVLQRKIPGGATTNLGFGGLSTFPNSQPAAKFRYIAVVVIQSFVNLIAELTDGTTYTAIASLNSTSVLNDVAKDRTWLVEQLVYSASSATAMVSTAALRIGRPRYDTLVNQRPMTTTQGEPYQRGNECFFSSSANLITTGAIGGSGPIFYADALLCLYSRNGLSGTYTKQASYEFQRDGRFWGDGVGQILFEESSNQFLAITNSWGNNEVSPGVWNTQVWIWRTDANATAGHVRFSQGNVLNFDNANYIHYDPSLVQIGGVWYVTCTRKQNGIDSNSAAYWPVCYQNTSARPETGTWTLVWEDKSQVASGNNYEGNCFAWRNGVCYTYAAGRDNNGYRCYNTVSGQFIGTFPPRNGYRGNPGHYCELVERRDGQTYYYLLLMDGATSIVQRANQVTTGYPWPLRAFAR